MWAPLAEELHRRFHPAPALSGQIPEADILVPEEGFTLRDTVRAALGKGLPDNVEAELEFCIERDRLRRMQHLFYEEFGTIVVDFCWDSGGPMSTFYDLRIWDLPGSCYFLSFFLEDHFGKQPEAPLAAIRKDAGPGSWGVLLSSVVWDVVDEIFGSLPDLTTNSRPDLLSAEAIRQFLFRWMTWKRDTDWIRLRDRILRRAEKGILRSFWVPDEIRNASDEELDDAIASYLRREREQVAWEAETLDEEDRERIFSNYFSITYREREG